MNIWMIAILVVFIITGITTASLAADEVFPLLAWDYVDDDATLKSMADCGINMAAFVPVEALDACKKHGIKAIVYDERVCPKRWDSAFDADKACKALPEIIKKVNNHPAVYGYHIKDEPNAGEYPAIAKAIELVKKQAPGKWAYVNLLPGWDDNYDTYLEQFVEICKPTILSYDVYAVTGNGGLGDAFWSSIARMRRVAQKNDLPFWMIILSAPHWSYPDITASDIQIQVYGSLVYGARGLSYYKFVGQSLPVLEAPELGNWRAPLDKFGRKTPIWDWLRYANSEVTALGPTLLKLESNDVYHFGDVPDQNHGPSDKTLVKAMTTPGQWVVGDFTHEDGSRWIMVVNKEPKRSLPCQPEFNSQPKSLQYFETKDGQLKPFPAPYYWLAPGQGVLLKLAQQ